MSSLQKILLSFGVLALLHTSAHAADNSSTAPASQPAPESQPATHALTDADNGKSITIAPGTPIILALAANATTGYSWSRGKIEGTAVTAVGDIQYTPNATRGLVGAGGTATATFLAAKEGQATITLNYTRPWEKDTAPVKTFTLTITVKPGAQ